MAEDTLLLLIREVRGKTLRLLDGLTERQAQFAAPGLNNTILWHAGHTWFLGEALVIAAATGRPPQDPPGWFEKFSWNSNPATVTEWPRLADVADALIEQKDRLLDAVASLTPEPLDRPIGDPSRGRTVRWSILHGLHDEACHQGEIWLLRKMLDPRAS